VRDGSRKTLAQGYWLCQIVAVECGGQEIVPLVNHLWSHEAPGFRSENGEIRGWVKRVARATGKRGVWVMDRGGDRKRLYEAFLRWKLDFLVRLVGNRDLIVGGRRRLASAIAAGCPLPYAETVRRHNSDGTETCLMLEFGYREVRLPGWEKRPLWLLVVRGLGEQPLKVLTMLALRRNRRALWWAVEAYLTRWRIEDTLRFAKQTYGLEDVRVRGYESLRNLMALALVAMYFTMVELAQRTRLAVLCHHALRAARRLFGIPDFHYYAIADGIREICAGRQAPPFNSRRPDPPGGLEQLDLIGFG